MKTGMFWIALLIAMLGILAGAMTLNQRPTPGNTSPEPAPGVASQEQRAKADAQLREFETETLAFERKLVKKEPFSATLIIEQFPEGTSDTHSTTSLIYRDNEGRTRRDQMQANGNVTQAPETTTINDPVDGFTYLIQHRDNTARRTKLNSHAEESSRDSIAVMQNSVSDRQRAGSYQILPAPVTGGREKGLNRHAAAAARSETRNESLGEREIEGVATEGTRITMTIPDGGLGNERVVQIVTERWYSPKLKTVVLIERFDPRFGRSVYRLSEIKSIDPAATLFTVPPNYKIIIE